MNMFYPTLGIAEIGAVELHGVPQVVVTPVLPILYHAVNGNVQFTVAVKHSGKFGRRLVALATLHKSKAPERQHRHGACKLTYACYNTIGIASIDEIVVYASAVVGDERKTLLICPESGGRIIVPEQSVTLYGLYYVAVVVGVTLYHTAVGTAHIHTSLL